jgi:hypothetical protein
MGHTENKILLTKVWQKPNTYQLNCGSQTLAWQSVARNQTGPFMASHTLAWQNVARNQTRPKPYVLFF